MKIPIKHLTLWVNARILIVLDDHSWWSSLGHYVDLVLGAHPLEVFLGANVRQVV